MILNSAKNIMMGNDDVHRIFCKGIKVWERPGLNPDDWVYTIENNEVRILGYKGNDTEITMPSVIDGCPVRYVGTGQYLETISGIGNIISIKIADSVRVIEAYAFYCQYIGHLKLRKVWFGNGVETIGEQSFSYCRELEYVHMGCSLKQIGKRAFDYSCNDTDNDKAEIIIGENVEIIGERAFLFCAHVNSFTIPDTVKEIKEYAFSDCQQIENIVIPDSVSIIGRYAFYKCVDLKSVTLNNAINSIPDYMFQRCWSLKTVYIPSVVQNIGVYSFSECTVLSSVQMPQACSYSNTSFYSSPNVKITYY